jgi:hypothetical protein
VRRALLEALALIMGVSVLVLYGVYVLPCIALYALFWALIHI